jgi:DNA polymerase-3 subunit delta'
LKTTNSEKLPIFTPAFVHQTTRMLFAQVIGQDNVKAHLLQLAQSGRLPHALLFVGPPGTGKRTLAWALAQYVLCLQPTQEDACGQCSQCQQVAKMQHPDLHFSFPSVGKEAKSEDFIREWRSSMAKQPYFDAFTWISSIGDEKKQGNITKEECVHIVHKVSLMAYEGKKKILIMWLPEYLGKEGNRLLKLIEEPPDNTLFILIAEALENILPTILSRCQLIRVDPLGDDEIAAALPARMPELTADMAHTLAMLADGNFNTALQLSVSTGNDYAGLLVDWLRACHQRNAAGWYQLSEELNKLGREKQKHLLSYGLHFLREALANSIVPAQPVRIRGELLTVAQKFMQRLEPLGIGEMAALLSDCHYHIERNANAKILFMHASIRMHEIMQQSYQHKSIINA